jgi:hypothetical protein
MPNFLLFMKFAQKVKLEIKILKLKCNVKNSITKKSKSYQICTFGFQ